VCLSHRVILQINPAGCLTPYGAKTAKETVAGKTGIRVRDDWREEWAQDRGRASLSIGKPVCPCEVGRGGVAEDNKGGRESRGEQGRGEVCVMERMESARRWVRSRWYLYGVLGSRAVGGKAASQGALPEPGRAKPQRAADGGRHA
jgi:hypothetical protein